MTKQRFAGYVCCLPMSLSLILYRGLPADFPMQFNGQGDVIESMPKFWALFLLNSIGIYLNWLYFYRIKKNPSLMIASQVGVYLRLAAFSVIASTIVVSVYLMHAKEVSFNMSDVISVIIGSLLLIIGNFLPTVKNKKMFYFPLIGDEAVDNRVWRILGFAMAISGLIFYVNLFFHSHWLRLIPLVLCVIVPLIATIYYRQSNK